METTFICPKCKCKNNNESIVKDYFKCSNCGYILKFVTSNNYNLVRSDD